MHSTLSKWLQCPWGYDRDMVITKGLTLNTANHILFQLSDLQSSSKLKFLRIPLALAELLCVVARLERGISNTQWTFSAEENHNNAIQSQEQQSMGNTQPWQICKPPAQNLKTTSENKTTSDSPQGRVQEYASCFLAKNWWPSRYSCNTWQHCGPSRKQHNAKHQFQLFSQVVITVQFTSPCIKYNGCLHQNCYFSAKPIKSFSSHKHPPHFAYPWTAAPFSNSWHLQIAHLPTLQTYMSKIILLGHMFYGRSAGMQQEHPTSQQP